MNFSIIHSAQNDILEANQVDIEVDISNGLHSFTIVGLADRAVEESRDRISSAIKNSNFTSPKKKNHKIVMSLAPANLRKSGPNFDLPMALAYLKATKEINFDTSDKLFIGELSLDGRLKKVSGILPIIIMAKEKGFSEIYIPTENSVEASLIKGIKIFTFNTLIEITEHLKNKAIKKPIKNLGCEIISKNQDQLKIGVPEKFFSIKGQEKAKRGLEIAAAGGHNIGFYGPPGTGKTMLSKSIVEILPPLNYNQVIETTAIHSMVNLNNDLITYPPFRSPHHTSSHSSIIGGGSYLKPGEISLAHNGVLFLDETPEFDKKTIDSLRQPIEDGYINLSRLHQKSTLPSDFILIITMNPCPCGYYKSNVKKCSCSMSSIEKYRRRISGPIIDRVDMWIEVNNIESQKMIELATLNQKEQVEKLSALKNKIISARKLQKYRQGKILNNKIDGENIHKYCSLNTKTENLIKEASDKLNLSIRSYNNILKLTRTIADLEESKQIEDRHILEALQYRPRF